MDHYYDEPSHVASYQKKKCRTDSMGFLNYVEILRKFTIKYELIRNNLSWKVLIYIFWYATSSSSRMDQQHLTQGREKWTWILIVIFATPITPTQYEIQPLRNNHGLIYAKVEPLRITSTYWRIVVYTDPQHLQDHLQSKNISTDIKNVYSTCLDQSIEEDCRSEVRVDLLNVKVKQIENIYEELKNILTTLFEKTPSSSMKFPQLPHASVWCQSDHQRILFTFVTSEWRQKKKCIGTTFLRYLSRFI